MLRFLKLGFWAFVIATPIAGAWLASSLGAWFGLNVAYAALSGFLLFPIVPLAWIGFSEFRRRGVTSAHVLTFGDRLLWRTLLLNLAFLSVLLWKWPQQSFLALSTRGDWMLEGRTGEAVDRARGVLLATAGRVEWIYLASHKNPYAREDKKAPPPPPPPATETALATPDETAIAVASPAAASPSPAASQSGTRIAVVSPRPTPTEAPAVSSGSGPSWPVAATLDPIVASFPPAEESSIDSIGKYIASKTDDPVRRAKAIHDYVADRIAYDFAALSLARIPDEDALAEPVWKSRKGVCAGYADLFVAIAKAAGVEAVYLTGDARDQNGGTAPGGHAWNAVKIRDNWYLVDATWDAGAADTSDGGRTFHKNYRTLYLFTPPSVFGLDHFPDEDGWQLRASPLRRADFVRQPLVRAQFVAAGLELLSPDKPQVSAGAALDVRLKNPRGRSILVTARRGDAKAKDCTVTGTELTEAHCSFDEAGAWHVSLFSSPQRFGMHDYVGGIDVNAAP